MRGLPTPGPMSLGSTCTRGPRPMLPLVARVIEAVDVTVAALPVPYRTTETEPELPVPDRSSLRGSAPRRSAVPCEGLNLFPLKTLGDRAVCTRRLRPRRTVSRCLLPSSAALHSEHGGGPRPTSGCQRVQPGHEKA